MADMGSKGDQSGKQASEKLVEDTIEAVIADAGVEQGEAPAAPSPAAAAQKSKLGLFIIIVLFLIAASVGGLKLTGQLQPMYESFQAQLGLFQTDQANPALSQANHSQLNQSQTDLSQTSSSQTIPSQPHQPQMKVGSSARMPVQKTSMPAEKPQSEAVAKRVQSVQSEAQPVVAVSGTGVTSAEVSALLAVIDQLRTEMQQLEASQQTLHAGLLEQQQMNTQVRLRWIADPASRLPQMQLAWEEISLLPGLTRDQRELAVEMHALARSDVQRVVSWKANLQRWVEALATPVHADVLPQPQQPWLAWIIGQFQLRHAPSAEARHLADLRGRLLETVRQLSLESWPAQAEWQSLHAELLLQIKAMQGDGDTVETGLPLDFSSIQHDINILRRAAQQWSAADQQGDL